MAVKLLVFIIHNAFCINSKKPLFPMNVFVFFWTFKMNWRDWLLQTNWLQMLRAPKHLLPKAKNWMSAREAILAAEELDTEGDTVEALMKKFFVNSGKSRKRTICLFASKYPRSRSRFLTKEAKRRISKTSTNSRWLCQRSSITMLRGRGSTCSSPWKVIRNVFCYHRCARFIFL